MTTKSYLQQIERLDRMIQGKLTDVYQLRQMAQSITAAPKEVNIQVTGASDKLGNTVSKIVDLENEIDALVDNYIDMRKKIVSQIDGMENTDMYHILTERYIARKDWKDILCTMDYSFRRVMQIHGKALQEFEKKYGAEYLNVESLHELTHNCT